MYECHLVTSLKRSGTMQQYEHTVHTRFINVGKGSQAKWNSAPAMDTDVLCCFDFPSLVYLFQHSDTGRHLTLIYGKSLSARA